MENLEQIKSLLAKITGISVFSERQTEYIKVWVDEWEMSAEDIVSAYEATLNMHNKVNFCYWNAVLKARYEDRLLKRNVKAMIFHDKRHETAYNDICSRMKYLDCYHQAVAYLITLDSVCRQHINDIFDFPEDVIKPECLNKPWQTGTSKKTTRLAFNLWNGYQSEGEPLAEERISPNYTPEHIFACSYAPYYWQAIQIRFEMNV